MFKFNLSVAGVAAVGLLVASPAMAASLTAPTQTRSIDYLLIASAPLEAAGITEFSSGTTDDGRQSPLLVPGEYPVAAQPSGPTQRSSGPRGRDSPLLVAPDDIVTPVPEPATWALMILGFGMVGSILRRRRRVMQSSQSFS